MLFYMSIFVVILIAALHTRFFYTAIANKNRSVHTSNKRIAITDSSRKYQKERTGFKINNDLPIPSVEEGGLVSLNLGKKHPADPVVCHKLKTARLIYEESLLSMNESYKARCRAESGPPTLEMVSKPFRRKVVPWAKDNKTAIRPWKTQKCLIPIAEPTYSELTHTGSNNAE
jgi:hypothetical protein